MHVPNLGKWKVLLLIFAVRLVSVFFVQTWYVADEFWQCLEVAHKLAFGYGHLTWEWTQGIRSYIPPAIIALLYKGLEFLSLDHPEILVIVPRILQALLSSTADYAFYKWSGRHKWALFLVLIHHFWFYTATRTIANTTETALLTLTLARFPFNPGHPKDNGWLCLAAIGCAIRPTSVIPLLPLFIYNFFTTRYSKLRLIAFYYIPIVISIGGLSALIDWYHHGEFVFTAWEFLKLNVFNEIGSFYGIHSWYWYFIIGFPVVLGVNLLPFTVGIVETFRYRSSPAFRTHLVLLSVILVTLGVYSLLPHKEFRFILPVLPCALFISQDTLSRWSRKASSVWVNIVFILLVIGNITPATYLSVLHQRGVLDVMPILRDIANKHPSNTSLLFLMPCHSTPLYSHLHVNIPVRFLTCEPNLDNKPSYKDEADQFYENPEAWFQREYLAQQVGETETKSKIPSHLILFNELVPRIEKILAYYNLSHSIYHTKHPVDSRHGSEILIYEKSRKTVSKPAPKKLAV